MNEERLRRQLRAQAAVNRQLHAQLADVAGELRAVKGNEASAVRVLWRQAQSVLPAPVAARIEGRFRGALGQGVRPRRSSGRQGTGPVKEWLDDLAASEEADAPFLVQDPEGATYLVEGTRKRPVPRVLVIELLRAELGPARPRSVAQLDELDDGPPVELLAAPGGDPFVVIGGRRRSVVGFPTPFVVEEDDVAGFDDGAPLRVGRMLRALEHATTDAPQQASVVGWVRSRAGAAVRGGRG